MKGKLLVISGLSAAGKGTIASALVSRFKDYSLSISATTREKRKNEIDGVHYFFIDKSSFENMIKEGKLLEHAKYVDNYYGTPKEYVENELKKGTNVILEIEMQGALQIKKIFNEAIIVFFLPKDAKTQRERLIHRNRESKEQIEERIRQAVIDADYAKHYDYVLVNEDLDSSIVDIEEIVAGKYDKNKNTESLKVLDKIVKDIKEEQKCLNHQDKN